METDLGGARTGKCLMEYLRQYLRIRRLSRRSEVPRDRVGINNGG